MNKTLKIVLWILAGLAALAVIAVVWGKSVFNKISFSAPKLQALDLKGLTIADFLSAAFQNQQKEVTAILAIDIINRNGFSIPFTIYKINLMYNGVVMAESSEALSGQKFILPANGFVPVSDIIKIILNNAGGQLLLAKLKGGHPELEYKILFSVFGIPVPYKGSKFTW